MKKTYLAVLMASALSATFYTALADEVHQADFHCGQDREIFYCPFDYNITKEISFHLCAN